MRDAGAVGRVLWLYSEGAGVFVAVSCLPWECRRKGRDGSFGVVTSGGRPFFHQLLWSEERLPARECVAALRKETRL